MRGPKLLALTVLVLIAAAVVAYQELSERQLERAMARLQAGGRVDEVARDPVLEESRVSETGASKGRRVRTRGWRTYFGSTLYLADFDAETNRLIGITRMATHPTRHSVYSVIFLATILMLAVLGVLVVQRIIRP